MSANTVINPNSLTGQVVAILGKLKNGHTRAEAYRAINDAKIVDGKGNPIIPSVYYHYLCMNRKVNGKTVMEENFPRFIATESPYARRELPRANDNTSDDQLNEMLVKTVASLKALMRARSIGMRGEKVVQLPIRKRA